MDTKTVILDGVFNFIIILMGIYLLNTGWQIYCLKSKKLLITTRISLFFLETVKGKKIREEKEADLLEPSNVKKYGISVIFAGGIFLFESIRRTVLLFR